TPWPAASGASRAIRNSSTASAGTSDRGVYFLRSMTANDRGARIERVPIASIRSRRFPSRSPATDDDLPRLTTSIREHGVPGPIRARRAGREYEVVCGQRRFQACKALGFADIVAVVRTLDDRQAFEIALAENARRTPLSPGDRQETLRRLVSMFP